VARKAGGFMREIQNTSQSFIREMERAADLQDEAAVKPYEPPPYEPVPYDAAAYDGKPYDDAATETDPYGTLTGETLPYDDAPTVAMPAVRAYEPPAPDPERPDTVSEKLAEPRPALGWDTAEPLRSDAAEPVRSDGEPAHSEAAKPAPEGDHATHL
jgi:hypothetical protein